MKKQFGYIAFVAIFLVLCLIPAVGMFLPAAGETGGNEVLAPLPALRDAEGAWNADFFAELGEYAEDNYYLRQRLVTAWSALNQKALHTSIADNVLLGSGGWLYFGDTLDDYTGNHLLSDAEIASAANNLALMSDYCESLGAKFLFTVAPNKNSLYPQRMPDLPVFSARRNADALRDALAAKNVPYYDLFEAFQAQSEILYFAQDSHWNSKGAALAADGLNRALGRKSDYFDGPFTAQNVHRGDLYAMLYPTGEALEPDEVYGGALDFTYDAPIRSPENLTIMTSGGGEGSLLMFRDSFGNLLYPYLADSFGSAFFSRAADYRLNLIEERNADYVVIELVERNIHYLIENIPVMPAPDLAAEEYPEEGAVSETAVALAAEPDSGLAGYVLVRGTLPVPPDAGAFVALCGPGGCYEAFRLRDGGFGLYVTETALEEDGLFLVTTVNGQAVSYPAV